MQHVQQKIRIVFDANPLVDNRKSGVGFYTQQLISRLAQKPDVQLTGHYFGKKAHLPDISGVSYIRSGSFARLLAYGMRKLGVRLPYELFIRRRADILLFPNFTRWPSVLRRPAVIVVHDMAFLDHPAWVRPKNQKFLSRYVSRDVVKTGLVLCPSEFTRQRLKHFYPLVAKSLVCGTLPQKQRGSIKPRLKLPKKYFLSVGTVEPRKNFLALAEAYCSLPANEKGQYGLVIAGGAGWLGVDNIAKMKSLASREAGLVLTDYVSSSELDYLYRHSSAVVCAALYEGLGMPAIEAMSYDKPTLLSDIPPFKESVGKSAKYFNPHEIEDIADALKLFINSSNLSSRLSKESTLAYRAYSQNQVVLFDKFYETLMELSR